MIGVVARRLKSLDAPIDLILVGLGFMGYGFLRRVQRLPGLRVALVITRDVARAARRLAEAGLESRLVGSPVEVEANARRPIVSLSGDPSLIGALPCPIVVEMTGEVAYGAEIALAAMDSGKHVVTMNAELQATIGSYLKEYAEARRVRLTDIQGDQPGSLAGLLDEARFYGFDPVMAGNIKGFLDRHATPATIGEWAARSGLTLKQTTSFTDGTKLALEMSLVANFNGMRVLKPGMWGHPAERLEEVLGLFDWDRIPAGGCVDYVRGGSLPSGVFVVGRGEDPEQAPYLRYLKLGGGPYYLLHRPYHLCHLEAPLTVARLALFDEPTIDNSIRPTTRVVAVAKRDLWAGEVVDGIGGHCCYGLADNVDRPGLADGAPIGLVDRGTMARPVRRDEPIGRQDIELPDNAATRIWQSWQAAGYG